MAQTAKNTMLFVLRLIIKPLKIAGVGNTMSTGS